MTPSAAPTTERSNDTTNLSPGTTYYYEVQATDGSNTSAPSDPANDTTVPMTPTIFTVTAVSASELDVTWTGCIGALGYDIQRMAAGGSWQTITQIQGANTITYHDTGLTDGVTYSYQVDAFNNAGVSAQSPAVSQTTLQTLPAAPVVYVVGSDLLSAQQSLSDSIQLVWQDAAYNESGFYVERSNDGGHCWKNLTPEGLPPGTTTYTVGPSDISEYMQYMVVAYNSAGESDSYAITPTAPGSYTAPAAPSQPSITSITQTTAETTVVYSTTTPGGTTAGGPVTQYVLEYSVNGGNFAVDPYVYASGSQYTITAAAHYPSDNTYTFEVVAQGPGGDTASASSDPWTPIGPIPGFNDYGVTAKVDMTYDSKTVTFHVDWTDSGYNSLKGDSGPGDPPIGFHVYFSDVARASLYWRRDFPDGPGGPNGDGLPGTKGLGDLQVNCSDEGTLRHPTFPQRWPDAGRSRRQPLYRHIAYTDVQKDYGHPGFTVAPAGDYPDHYTLGTDGTEVGYEYSADNGAHWYPVDSGMDTFVAPGATVKLRLYGAVNGLYGYSDEQTVTPNETIPQPTGLTATADPDGSMNPSGIRWTSTGTPSLPSRTGISPHAIRWSSAARRRRHLPNHRHRSSRRSQLFPDVAPNEDTKYLYRIRQQIVVSGVPVPGYSIYSVPAEVTTTLNPPILPYSYPSISSPRAMPTD